MQADRGNVPKFVVTPSVFAPNPVKAAERRATPEDKIESDAWPGFPATKKAILSHIVDNQIQNVIFLSGDIHCANIAELRFDGSPAAKELKAYAVTSSAFYWPFPFADGEPSEFVHDSMAENDTYGFEDSEQNEITMNYVAHSFTQDDNFAQITVDPGNSTLRVEFFDKEGGIVTEKEWTGFFSPQREHKLSKSLKLAAFGN